MNTPSTSYSAQQPLCAKQVIKLKERDMAAHISADCINVDSASSATKQQLKDNGEVSALTRSKLLDDILDLIFEKEFQAYDKFWLRWLMASGKTLEEFDRSVKDYDPGNKCGFTWFRGYLAYRCHTCKMFSDFALCGECFKLGNHVGHDVSLFSTQELGECDCGKPSFIMMSNWWCSEHKYSYSQYHKDEYKPYPVDLFRVTNKIIPRLLLKLVQYLRGFRPVSNTSHLLFNQFEEDSPEDLDYFLCMLNDLSKLGIAMREIMTVSFASENIYQWACNYRSNPCKHSHHPATIGEDEDDSPDYWIIDDQTNEKPNQNSWDSDESSEESDQNSRGPDQNYGESFNRISHSNFVQEIVFWTIKYKFPRKIVNLLLCMLPDANFKKALLDAFCMHYSSLIHLMETARDHKTISDYIVYINNRLLGCEYSAIPMINKWNMLSVTLSNLQNMMENILEPSTLHNWIKNTHFVVQWSDKVLVEQRYWPLTNDLNVMLKYMIILVKFTWEDNLFKLWFSYLSMFQGMHVNVKELESHIEYERTKFIGFITEYKVCCCTLSRMLLHFNATDGTERFAYSVLRTCLEKLRLWLMNTGCIHYCRAICSRLDSSSIDVDNIQYLEDRHKFSFHLPMHRFFAGFLNHTVRSQSIRVENIIPYECSDDPADRDVLLLAISTHPLLIQAKFYEIMQDAWKRNGKNIKRQANSYIHPDYSSYMVDTDIYLLQVCLSELSDTNKFMGLILEKFNAYSWMNFNKYEHPGEIDSEENDVARNMENIFVFLAILIGVGKNLCSDIMYDYCQFNLEMITLLCLSKSTHSQLIEDMPKGYSKYIPETTFTSSRFQFDTVLESIAEYKEPYIDASDKMHEGYYKPLATTWQNLYDPVHVLLRAGSRLKFQSSMEHYADCMRSIGLLGKNQTPWPPYRTPYQHHSAYNDPRRALLSRLFHTVTWHCLYQTSVYEYVDEYILSLVIHLLDQAWIYYSSAIEDNKSNSKSPEQLFNIEDICLKKQIKTVSLDDNNQDWKHLLDCWFDHDDLVKNLCTTITITKSESNSSSVEHDFRTETNRTKNELSSEPINESIISLLLRLHSYLSGKPDSYQPPSLIQITDSGVIDKVKSINKFSRVANDHHQEETQTSHCGDGTYYISNLLDKMTKESMLCYECVSRTRLELWPKKVVVNEQTQKDYNDKKRKRKLALLEEMARSQQAFLESTCNSSNLDSKDMPLKSTICTGKVQYDKLTSTIPASKDNVTTTVSNNYIVDTDDKNSKRFKKLKSASINSMDSTSTNQLNSRLAVDCAICRKSLAEEIKNKCQQAIGLVIFVQNTNILAHRRHLLTQPKTTNTNIKGNNCDTENKQNNLPSLLEQNNDTTYKSHYYQRHLLMTQYFNNLNKNDLKIGAVTITSDDFPKTIDGNVYVQTCGHYLHLKCLDTYLENTPQSQFTRFGFACPVCWQMSNSILPLVSSTNQHYDTMLATNTTSILTDTISKLTELIEQDNNYENSHKHYVDKDENNYLLAYVNKCVNHMIDSSQISANNTTSFFREPFPIASIKTNNFNKKWLNIVSVAWTNLQMKIVVGGNNKLSKNNCIAPLLKVLHLSAQSLLTENWKCEKNPLYDFWYKFIGRELSQESNTPLLLSDPCIILLQLLLFFPALQPEQFDALVKLAYNVQIYITALKVATEIECCDYNNMTEWYKYCYKNISPFFSPVNITQFKNATLTSQLKLPLFLNAVALAKNVMFPSQNTNAVKIDEIKNDDDEIITDDNKANMLESYARQSTLPFLRFAALLKKCTYGEDNLEEYNENSTSQTSSTPNKKTQQPLLCKYSKVNINDSASSTTPCHRPQNQQHCQDHWSQDDYEFLTLARYLKLLKDKHNHLSCGENDIVCDQSGGNCVQYSLLSSSLNPPSVMEAVFWPKSSNDGDTGDHVSTVIPRAWLTSLRKSLTIKIGQNSMATNLVDIPMATRLLLGMDCCGGGDIRKTSSSNNRVHGLPPTVNWTRPRLISLPNKYTDVFYYYYNRICLECKSVPRQPVICLFCGIIICSRSNCCMKNQTRETVLHSLDCGSGTGIFLDIRTCSVIVIRDQFYCFWGSLYLDEYGEDNFNNRRETPLHLNSDRYKLLERQWLTHRLDYIKTDWSPHNNKF